MAPEHPAFPAVVNCPICRQNGLHLFEDAATNGVWLNCTNCRAHGDFITFGATVWNLSLPETIVKFSEQGCLSEEKIDQTTAEYEKFYPRLDALETFISDSFAQTWSHADDIVATRLRDWGVHREAGNNFNTIVGVADYAQITKICSTLGRSKPARLREDGSGIVFPFHDLPGRLTGFLLLQYNERLESKQTFIPLAHYKKIKPEAGYFFLQASVLPPNQKFRDNQFISDDILWVLRAQCAHLKNKFELLPLLGSYTGPEANSYGNSWQGMPPAKRIFYTPTYTPENIGRACNARGYVAVSSTHFRQRDHYNFHEKAIGRLRDLLLSAETWPGALANALHNQTEVAAKSFCQRLVISPDKLNGFLTSFDHSFSDGFVDAVLAAKKNSAPQQINVRQRWVPIARETGWWTGNGFQISNASPQIKKVLQADDGSRVYVGRVSGAGFSFDFTVAAERIDRQGLFKYASTVLANNGKLLIYDTRWNRKSLLIAMQMHPPEIASVRAKLGWDELTNSFRFARYEITASGDIQRHELLPGQNYADNFPEPHVLAPGIQPLLTASNSNAFVWATAAHVIGNLVAPILKRSPVALALTPENFSAGAKVAAALNCRLTQTTNIKKNSMGNTVERILAQHDWPACVLNVFHDSVFSRIIPHYHLQPVIIRTTKQCAISATSYGWQTISPGVPETVPDCSALAYILPNYLQDRLRHRWANIYRQNDYVAAILGDLHDWLQKTYGETFNLEFARRIIYNSINTHELLKQELRHAINQNRIKVVPHPLKRQQPSNYFIRQHNAWWINRRAIDNYFFSLRSTPINWVGFTAALQENDLLIKEEIINNTVGVWVPSSWCDTLLTTTLPRSAKHTG